MSSVHAGAQAPDPAFPRIVPVLVMPRRLQLRRAKGFNLQEASRALNGLPAVNVARPTRWGNPFHHNDAGEIFTREHACLHLRAQVLRLGWYASETHGSVTLAAIVHHLRGKNLACFCPLDDRPCHADLLILIANFSLELQWLGEVAR